MSEQDDFMYFKDEAELNAAIYGENALDVTQAFINDKVRIGEAEGEEVEEVEEVIDPVETDTVEEPVAEPAAPAPVENKEVDFENKLAEMQKQFMEKEAALEKQLADRNAEFEKMNEPAPEPVEPVQAAAPIELLDEDLDLATEFEKNNRKLIEDIKQNSNLSTTELATKVAQLEAANKEYFDKIERENQQKAADANRQALYSELETFSQGKDGYTLPGKVTDVRSKQNEFKTALAETLGLSDSGKIEKAYRRVIRDDSAWAKGLIAKLEEAKVAVPDGSANYLNLVELHERRIGREFDVYTGEYKDVKDNYGNVSVLPDLDSAYRLANYDRLITNAGADQSLLIQQRLEEQENAAVTLDNNVLNSPNGEQTVSDADMSMLTTMDPEAIKRNPDLAAKYAAMCKQEGMKVPAIIEKAIKK